MGQVRDKAAQAGGVWEEKAPEPLRQHAAQGARLARENRALIVAAVGAVAVVWLVSRHRKG